MRYFGQKALAILLFLKKKERYRRISRIFQPSVWRIFFSKFIFSHSIKLLNLEQVSACNYHLWSRAQ